MQSLKLCKNCDHLEVSEADKCPNCEYDFWKEKPKSVDGLLDVFDQLAKLSTIELKATRARIDILLATKYGSVVKSEDRS